MKPARQVAGELACLKIEQVGRTQRGWDESEAFGHRLTKRMTKPVTIMRLFHKAESILGEV